jgi:hypothetical protein
MAPRTCGSSSTVSRTGLIMGPGVAVRRKARGRVPFRVPTGPSRGPPPAAPAGPYRQKVIPPAIWGTSTRAAIRRSARSMTSTVPGSDPTPSTETKA